MILTNKIKYVIFITMLFFLQPFLAQEKEFTGSPDAAFKVARELAFDGKRAQAQDSLRFILTKYPNYLDIRSFLASTYSWDGNHDSARKEFKYVLDKDETRKTDWIAYIKNEQYADKYFAALELSEKALQIFPNNADLLQLKARSQFNAGKQEEAFITIKEAQNLHPNNQDINSYKNSLETELSFNKIGVSYSMEVYDKKARDNMYFSTVQYGRQTKFGSINGKLNYSHRFATNNYQFEVDLYPKIIKGLYAYVSGGFSNSKLFPSSRYGGELFKSLPKSFEASLGFRWLKFSTSTTIYTGSVGWYTGNSYWSFRTYVTPGSPGASKSGTLSYRIYSRDADNYFGFSVGYGASPEHDRFIENATGDEIFHLDSQKLNFKYSTSSQNTRNVFGLTAGFYREEKPFAKGEYYLYASFGVSYGVKFK